MGTDNENGRGFISKGIVKLIIVLFVVILIALFVILRQFLKDGDAGKEKTTVVTSSRLEKVLQISELSTYKVTYNGVASVKNDDDELLYHVAYEAKISVGLDMEKIQVEVDESEEENKKIIVTLPEIEIMDVDVNPGSLDYIFEKKSADTDDVSMAAFPACRADVEEECKSNEVLFELARENAGNTIKALVKPLLEQYEEYSLEIVSEGGQL